MFCTLCNRFNLPSLDGGWMSAGKTFPDQPVVRMAERALCIGLVAGHGLDGMFGQTEPHVSRTPEAHGGSLLAVWAGRGFQGLFEDTLLGPRTPWAMRSFNRIEEDDCGMVNLQVSAISRREFREKERGG